MTSNKLSQSEYDRRMIVTRQKYYEDDVICRYCGPDGCDCEVYNPDINRPSTQPYPPHIDSDRHRGPSDWDRECQESGRLNR